MNFKELVKDYTNESLKTLQQLIQIDSVYDVKTINEKMPYGEGVFKAHQFMKELAIKDGFQVDECDNRCLEISCGEGDTLVGVFAHLDVVPISGEWKYPPFSATIKDNKMYGRGTSDDKGPGVSAYYALKALKDNNLIKNYRVKLVFGCDEERGSSCLEYYFNHLKKEQPTYGFTPDAEFPVIYGEKGITNLFFEFPVTLPQIKSLKGGIVLNAVCDKCEVEIESNKDFIDFATSRKYINCDIVDNGKIMKLTFKGKTAHGSTPEKGINAALMALKALGQFYEYAKLVDIADNFSVYNGKAINGYSKGKYLGESTFNVGTISIEDNVLKLGVNYRFPEDVSVENTISRIKEVFNAKITHDEISPYLLLNPQSKLIQTLMKAYYRETGDKTPIFTIGGGTYAKHAKNTVAFGAMFPHSVDTMHQPDEYMNLDDLFKASVIYCRAIDTLGKLK